MLDAGRPGTHTPHFELSFRLCGCASAPPPEALNQLRPDPALWLDLRPVDKPVATLYLFRRKPPLQTRVLDLDSDGLERFMDEHPWEDSRTPCSTSNL